jgi:hypothetical protein
MARADTNHGGRIRFEVFFHFINILHRFVRYMKQVTVYTTNKEYSHFLELAKNLHYIKKIEIAEDPKENVLDNIKAGLEEVRFFKKGKLKTTLAKDFLNEL